MCGGTRCPKVCLLVGVATSLSTPSPLLQPVHARTHALPLLHIIPCIVLPLPLPPLPGGAHAAPASHILDRWFDSEILKTTLATDAVIGALCSPTQAGSAYVLLHHVMGEAAGQKV